ncbi:hypothetical protein CRUP_008475 [Coryphaenoides rupestris]|nr:hypothetical protein CRUP_008475 [Coryphaenoides rupestris]
MRDFSRRQCYHTQLRQIKDHSPAPESGVDSNTNTDTDTDTPVHPVLDLSMSALAREPKKKGVTN